MYKLNKCPIGTKLGEGSYGSVYQYDGDDNHVIKVFDETSILGSTAELDILFNFNHPNLLKGVDIYDKGTCGIGFSLVLEKLDFKINECLKLYQEDVKYVTMKYFFIRYAEAISYLHKNNYLHLDLHQNNLMVKIENDEAIAKVIDFSQASKFTRDINGNVIPVLTTKFKTYTSHVPIENINQSNDDIKKYTDKTDVWSFGITLLESFRTVSIFDTNDIVEEYIRMKNQGLKQNFIEFTNDEKAKIIIEKFIPHRINTFADLSFLSKFLINDKYLQEKIPKDEFPLFYDLILGVLNPIPENRLTMEQVVNHQFFNLIPKGNNLEKVNEIDKFNSYFLLVNDKNLQYKYEAIVDLINFCIEYFLTASTEILFNSIHIYIRIITDQNYINITVDDILNLSKLSVLIVVRMYDTMFSVPEIILNDDKIWDHEFLALRTLKMKLNVDYFYDHCSTFSDLMDFCLYFKFPIYKFNRYNSLVNKNKIALDFFTSYFKLQDFKVEKRIYSHEKDKNMAIITFIQYYKKLRKNLTS